VEYIIGIVIKIIDFIFSTMLDGYLYIKELFKERKKNKGKRKNQ